MPGDPLQTPARPPRSRTLLAWLLALTILRLAVAAATPLSPDEAYYWIWSKALAPGYLDHPPMVALWIRLGTALAGDTALGIRLLAPLSAALGSILLARAADTIWPGRHLGWRAALLLNATLMLGAGAVTMTPDTPLLMAWTTALWALAHIAAGQGGGPAGGPWWLVVGAAAGLGLDSKYTAALLGLGIALWLLTPAMRAQLRTPWPWLGAAVALLAFLPVILWNAAHGWASFIKQGGRTGDFDPSRALRYLAELLGGQVGLATPVIFALMLAGTIAALRRWRDPREALLAALILPGAAVFIQHALGDRVQANWVAILYPAAAIAAARYPKWTRPAAATGLACTAILYLQASLAPLPLPRAADPTLRLAGFDTLARDAAAAARQDHAAFIASEEYGLAALLAFHQPGLPVIAADPRWRLFDLPPANPSAPGLLLLSTRRKEPPDPAFWPSAAALGILTRGRPAAGQVEAETYRLFRVTAKPGAPAVLLPTRSQP